MLKWLVIIVAGFILYKMFTMDKKKKSQIADKEKSERIKTGDMVKDPVCGKYIPTNSDIRVRKGETVHRFCSYECRQQYLQSIGVEVPTEGDTDKEAEKDEV